MSIPTQPQATTAPPTQADAQLVVQLMQLASTPAMERGHALLWKHRQSGGLTHEQFVSTYPIDSSDAGAVIAVMKWHETVGTLVKQGLLHRGLVYDWLWVRGTWEACADIARGMREETGTAAMWENFEALALGQED